MIIKLGIKEGILKKSGVHSESRLIDKETISCLENILSASKLIDPDLKAGDTYPNIDGNVTVLETIGGEAFGRLEVQVKKLVRKKTMVSYSLDDDFIEYAKKHPEAPPLLIVVDTEQFVAYWIEMNRRALSHMKGKTVRLDPKREISKNSLSYYSRWKKLISNRRALALLSNWRGDHHLKSQDINFFRENYNNVQRTIEKNLENGDREEFKNYIFPESLGIKGGLESKNINKISKSFVSQIKKEYLLPLLDFAFPVFSDNRGEQKKLIISEILKIPRQEEEDMIKRLIAESKLSIRESLYIISNTDEIIAIQKKMIDEGIITVEDLITLFINEGYE